MLMICIVLYFTVFVLYCTVLYCSYCTYMLCLCGEPLVLCLMRYLGNPPENKYVYIYNLLLAYTYSDWSKGVVMYLQTSSPLSVAGVTLLV